MIRRTYILFIAGIIPIFVLIIPLISNLFPIIELFDDKTDNVLIFGYGYFLPSELWIKHTSGGISGGIGIRIDSWTQLNLSGEIIVLTFAGIGLISIFSSLIYYKNFNWWNLNQSETKIKSTLNYISRYLPFINPLLGIVGTSLCILVLIPDCSTNFGVSFGTNGFGLSNSCFNAIASGPFSLGIGIGFFLILFSCLLITFSGIFPKE